MSNLETAERIILGRTATAAAKELHDQGLLMPDLPTPEIGALSGIPRWYVHNWSISREPNDDTATNYVLVDHEPRMTKPYVFTPQDARTFALSILAAANYEEVT